MNSILIFGAAELQGPLIENSKKLNFHTIAIDPDKNAESRYKADIFEVVEGSDFEKTLDIANKYKVKGIITSSTDKPLLMMAKIAEKLNLRFPSYESILNSTNKYLMKKCFAKNGIPSAKGLLIGKDISENRMLEILRILKIPIIIKPIDNSGSRGVLKCDDISEVIPALKFALKYSSSSNVLIEEYIDGKEFSVESICNDDEINIIQITEKITTDKPFNVEMGHLQPAKLNGKELKLITDITIDTINALNLKNCACHTEIKLNDKGAFIIENGPRLGGDFITSYLTPLSSGINIEAALINIATGNIPDIKTKLCESSGIKYVHLEEGYVKKIDEWKEIFEIPGILKTRLNLKINQKINKITNSLDRYGYIIANGKTREDVERSIDIGMNFLKSKIRIE